MKVHKQDGSAIRKILTALIVSKEVLAAALPQWGTNMLGTRQANLIGNWCVDYFRRYHKAPKADIQDWVDKWAIEHPNEKETSQLMEKVLEGLSNAYERRRKEVNVPYTIDLIAEYCTRTRLKGVFEEGLADIENGEVAKAIERHAKFSKVELGIGAVDDVGDDPTLFTQALTDNRDVLIKYPDGLGYFFGSALERDGLIAFEGPEKRGKTFILLDLAYRAARQGRKVIFFEVGDMSRNQIARRLASRMTKRPMTPRTILLPTHLEPVEGDETLITHTEKVFSKGLTIEQIDKARKRFTGLWKTSVHPNNSISVNGIKAILDGLQHQGWVPDVIVIDYVDLLAPPVGIVESRDQINATWKGLRALSQIYHCLVVTATQSNAQSYSAETLSMKHFSEDKRKHAHITGMIGLNATDPEKAKGLLRLNWIALREAEFDINKCCYVAGCLAIANPCVLSTF